MFLLSPPTSLRLPSLKPLKSSSFFHGSLPLPLLNQPSTSSFPAAPPPPSFLPIKAMKKLQGKVVCSTNDKTVAVEVTRIYAHPKYKRRIKSKKKYQAHDPLNQFKVGDIVQLEKSRPISKTKSFLAVSVAPKNKPKSPEAVPEELGLPLEPARS
ncbi:30S ribosomal protein S17 [Nymphaea thermarum]|nr:30S ribosomal protein S17 [Nymphaea thermarum]